MNEHSPLQFKRKTKEKMIMYKGIRAGKTAYIKYLKEQENLLAIINKLYKDEAKDIIASAKQIAETTTLTLQEALEKIKN